jgi:hypothetical protein
MESMGRITMGVTLTIDFGGAGLGSITSSGCGFGVLVSLGLICCPVKSQAMTLTKTSVDRIAASPFFISLSLKNVVLTSDLVCVLPPRVADPIRPPLESVDLRCRKTPTLKFDLIENLGFSDRQWVLSNEEHYGAVLNVPVPELV